VLIVALIVNRYCLVMSSIAVERSIFQLGRPLFSTFVVTTFYLVGLSLYGPTVYTVQPVGPTEKMFVYATQSVVQPVLSFISLRSLRKVGMLGGLLTWYTIYGSFLDKCRQHIGCRPITVLRPIYPMKLPAKSSNAECSLGRRSFSGRSTSTGLQGHFICCSGR